MFRQLQSAYADLVASIQDYAASFRESARRVRELHGLDHEPTPHDPPTRVLNGRAKGTVK